MLSQAYNVTLSQLETRLERLRQLMLVAADRNGKTVRDPRIANWEQLGILAVTMIAVALLTWAHARHPYLPSKTDLGWFNWFDQSWYLKSALAWSHWNLDPSQHFYLPGYALAATLFARLTPTDPFFVPNLIFLAASTWLFAALTRRLAPELPAAGLVGAVVFLVASVGSPTMREQWVVPISSSGSTPLIYGALLATIAYIDNPARTALVAWAAIASATIGAFRPADAGVVSLVVGSVLMLAALTSDAPIRNALRAAAAGVAAAAAIAGLILLSYLIVNGWKQNSYLTVPSVIGFEWRLIPIRWVSLVIDPHPLYADGESLLHRFPYIAPGIAGCVALLIFPTAPRRRLAEALVVGTIALHFALYMAFRDLHSGGLFRFGNYHYFKWILPLLALYALRLAILLAFGPDRWRRAAAAGAACVLLFGWRAEFTALPMSAPLQTTNARTLTIPDVDNFRSTQAYLVPAVGEWGAIYGVGHELEVGARTWGYFDVRLFPQPNGFMVAPLRTLGSGLGELRPAKTVDMRPDAKVVKVRQRIVPGLPCVVLPERAACQSTELIEAPALAAGTKIPFGSKGGELPYLVADWSFPQDDGRWSDGADVRLRFRPEGAAGDVKLSLSLSPFMPPKAPPLEVDVYVNGRKLDTWRFATGDIVDKAISVPRDLLLPGGALALHLHIRNPRSPNDFSPGSRDTRRLGLFVRALDFSLASR